MTSHQQQRNGRLITIEGVDGAGKSTLVDYVADILRQQEVSVLQLREPGGSELSERLRVVLADAQLHICDRSEALLFMAARAQLVVEKIYPALQAGAWVLLDRFTDSSLVYQGVARGLGLQQVKMLNDFATTGLKPDKTLLLTLSADAAANRRKQRNEGSDRFEQESHGFFEKILAGYQLLATQESERICLIDANQPFADVCRDALSALQIRPIL